MRMAAGGVSNQWSRRLVAATPTSSVDDVELTRFGGHCSAFAEEVPMPRYRSPYPREFREQLVALVRSGRSPVELAKEFEPTVQCIRNWVAQADRDEGRRADGLTSQERDELRRLRKENKRLKVERDILGKAAAWFARETNSIPPKGSSS